MGRMGFFKPSCEIDFDWIWDGFVSDRIFGDFV